MKTVRSLGHQRWLTWGGLRMMMFTAIPDTNAHPDDSTNFPTKTARNLYFLENLYPHYYRRNFSTFSLVQFSMKKESTRDNCRIFPNSLQTAPRTSSLWLTFPSPFATAHFTWQCQFYPHLLWTSCSHRNERSRKDVQFLPASAKLEMCHLS